MITKRDEEILKFINFFGKTYTKVLEKTFFPSFSAAENRVANLKKQDIISFWNTNLVSPRRAIVLSESTKNYFERHLDIKVKKTKIHLSTIEHNIIEQITFFWLQKIGEVKRTVVFNDSKDLNHTPDFILFSQEKKINIEIEITKKTEKRYKEIIFKSVKDGADYMLYVLRKKEDVKSFAEYMPRSNKLMFIDIDSLIFNIKTTGKISPIFQEELLFYDEVWVKIFNSNYVFNYGKKVWFLNSYLFTTVKVTKKAVSELGRYLFFYLNPNI